ncbi:hypothetical protein A2U01_0063570, partial [Trifolium medium]|nr:hypothetical protein [Trifolium medium]
IQVPKKGEDATAEGDATNDLLNPAKKKRVTGSTTGRSLLLQGRNNQNLTVGGDTMAQELTEVVARKTRSRPLLSGMQISTPRGLFKSNLKSMVILPPSPIRLLRNSGRCP